MASSTGMSISEPVASSLSGVEFAFLSEKEIKALSVKRITNPSTFDTLLHPVSGGLYDTALGPYGDNACSTCGLKVGCPGHCGHIELPAPVYHPMFMDQCLRLLRAKCVYCHRLKMSPVDINRFSCKLRLIGHGLLKEAEEVDAMGAAKPKASNTSTQDGDSLDEQDDEETEANYITEQRNKFVKRAIKNSTSAKKDEEKLPEKTEAMAEARRVTIKEFYAALTKPRKCHRCKGISPGYRKDRFSKIFRKPLLAKDKALMIQAGFKAESAIVILNRRRDAADKNKSGNVHDDEGVADLGATSSDSAGEDTEMADIEDEVVDGNLFATEATTKTKTNSGIASSTDSEKSQYMSPTEVHSALVFLFETEQDIFKLVYGSRLRGKHRQAISADIFFIHTLLVPPNQFRPEAYTGDTVAESQDNTSYRDILRACESIRQIHSEINGGSTSADRRRRDFDDLQNVMVQLQDAVNSMIDRDKSNLQGPAAMKAPRGVKQKLEKKEGLFRMNMMGKRVNFAARTVISPDPNIETNEIGVPPVFAMKLTYPEPVTSHNFYELKEAVINGPNKWPGAVAIENEKGQVLNLKYKNAEERQALANQLLARSNTTINGSKNKKVHRHLNNGDVVIMNRQPTLHKPSMMCHRVKVLTGEKTLRMHYANTKTYNADFDGDEMNMHFPQNEIARAEALTIADTDHQYLSATAGEPLRGLIQDHISIAVWLTNRDTFFNREEYQQLIYSSLRPEDNHTTSNRLITVPPALIKPRPMWTGKQVISTVLKNIQPSTHPGLTMETKSNTPESHWGKNSQEADVIFKDSELLCGIIDKKQIGPSSSSFVTAVYEAYGPTVAGKLLSVLGRLLTRLLSTWAFSCGVEDLILTSQGEKTRHETLKGADTLGLKIASKYVSLERDTVTATTPELKRRLESVLRDDTKQHGLDLMMNSQSKDLSSQVTSTCLPSGLIKQFPKNQMQTMTVSGAKGSQVNANLISCNLGQQVLEGRRVPIMVSGKTLPSFKPFDPSIRAGGYITDRFLTGIRPQEYFFHAMAGREGLIDTAVKTSSSGYLQRCLVKGMEGFKVEHDASVRNSDGAMVQFLYGEDGLEVTKAAYLNKFKFWAENFFSLFESLNMRDEFERIQSEDAAARTKSAYKKFTKTDRLDVADPALSIYSPNRFCGSTSENFYAAKTKYCEDNKDGLLKKKKKDEKGIILRKNFETALDVKYLHSVVEAGEAVGIVAGQSIGEPSTQMTLNTFHLAGHSAKNVTLGIPRLREIVMTASRTIKTPSMTVYLRSDVPKEEGTTFAKNLSRLSLSEVIDKATVTEKVGRGVSFAQAKTYKIRLDFYPSAEYCEEYAIAVKDVLNAVEKDFIPKLSKIVKAELKKKGVKTLKAGKLDALPEIGESVGVIEQQTSRPRNDNEDGEEDDGDGDGDGDATNARQKAKQNEDVDYDDPDEDEEEMLADNDREGSPIEDADETYGSDRAGSASPPPGGRANARASSTSEDEDSEIESSSPKLTIDIQECEERIKKRNDTVVAFDFDVKSGQWCDITLEFSAQSAKLLMLHLVERACRQAVIQEIPGVTSAVCMTHDMTTKKDLANPEISIDGCNLGAMHEFTDMIDVNRIFTNDIAAMLRLYGVEACRDSLVREMAGVFNGHGIAVDHRHLSLIADTMTRGGGYTPFNRLGFTSNPSPFMKMSFETSTGFIRDAVLEGDWDDLSNPSARLIVGRLNNVGTGTFDVLMPVA